MQNQVNDSSIFDRLWTTANESRYLKKAENQNGDKALKGIMWNSFKFVVKPSSSKGFIVKLIEFPKEIPIIDQNGEITFKHELNTQNAVFFYLDLRKWFEAFLTVFGELNDFSMGSQNTDNENRETEEDFETSEEN